MILFLLLSLYACFIGIALGLMEIEALEKSLNKYYHASEDQSLLKEV